MTSAVKSLFVIMLLIFISGCNKSVKETPIRVLTGFNLGESREIELTNGDKVKVKLIDVHVTRDSLRNAVRKAEVRVSVDEHEVTLISGNYNLPVTVGKARIDCPQIKEYYTSSTSEETIGYDAILRLWPSGSPIFKPGTFGYPIKQRWFSSHTQLGYEPTFVDWGENPASKKIYYHSGHDIGGAEGMDEIVSATNGIVVSSRNETLEGYDTIPVYTHMDAVNVIDDRGWHIEYVHLDSTDPGIKNGERVRIGQRIGWIGKQGTSGGWVHLHFQMRSKDLDGKWLTEEAYPYCREAYVNEYKPAIIAVARPHNFVWTDQEVTLDGNKSESFRGDIVKYEWTFTDSSTAQGPVQKRVYNTAGEYSEVLKVTDSEGNIDYDFAVVQVSDRSNPGNQFPTLQPAFHPTLNIKPGMPVTFLVRTFRSDTGNETWNFGDGSPEVQVKSETVLMETNTEGRFAETVHSFDKPGHYVVRVERSNEYGFKAIGHLDVVVEGNR